MSFSIPILLLACTSGTMPLLSDLGEPALSAEVEERLLATIQEGAALTLDTPCGSLLDPTVELSCADYVDSGAQDVLTAWLLAVDQRREVAGMGPLEHPELWLRSFEPGTEPKRPNGYYTRSTHTVSMPSAYGVGDFLSVALHEVGHAVEPGHQERPAVGLEVAGGLAGCALSEPVHALVLSEMVDRLLTVWYIQEAEEIGTSEGRYVAARLQALHLAAELGPQPMLETMPGAELDEAWIGPTVDMSLEAALEALASSAVVEAELADCADADRAAELLSWVSVRVVERRALRDEATADDRARVEAHLSEAAFTDPLWRHQVEQAWLALERQDGTDILYPGQDTLLRARAVLDSLTPPCVEPDPWACPAEAPDLELLVAHQVLASSGETQTLDALRDWAFPDGEPLSPWPEHVHNLYVVSVADALLSRRDLSHRAFARQVPCTPSGRTGISGDDCEEARRALR